MKKINTLTRRDFIRIGTLATVGGACWQFPSAMAGPFTKEDFGKLVPADKKLAEEWIRSLFERGVPDWVEGENLRHIGMPVGGICCGQVYLSGDGRLWHWDIFNFDMAAAGHARTAGPHYANPMPVKSNVDIDFSIRVRSDGGETIRPLDGSGFPDVRFRGAYPMGFVDFHDDAFPVKVSLEAFSPFSPLDTDGSSLPMTVMRYTVRNTSAQAVEVSLAGSMANPVMIRTGVSDKVELINRIVSQNNATGLHCSVRDMESTSAAATIRPDRVYDDFERDDHKGWTVAGTAFGRGPVVAAQMPAYQGDVGASGNRLVSSHHTRSGEGSAAADAHTGSLTSQAFKIERRFINALVSGGADRENLALQVLIDGKVVASVTGHNSNQLQRKEMDVSKFEGQSAQLRILDNATGSWGNIAVDHIVFSDVPLVPALAFHEQVDVGDMTLAVLGGQEGVFSAAGAVDFAAASGDAVVRGPSPQRPKGNVGKTFTLAAGEETTVSFAVAWRFPNLMGGMRGQGHLGTEHYYATRFDSSLAVIEQHAAEHEEVWARTRRWHETWYDSTLPYWLLDRTFVTLACLASTTCVRTDSGRFYGWEGVNCCGGTCNHVWHYAQSVGRVFPELERITRENVDYGFAYLDDGRILYRGEFTDHEAIDGQCGTILRVFREHTMSADDGFLRRIWPRVKGSIEFLIREDGDANGVLEGSQFNTLDSAWYGPISWISSLYLAALRAGNEMAQEMGDQAFADKCNELVRRGGEWLSEHLFDGEYFFHRRDPDRADAFGAGIGCHIDQIMGQSWAYQLGLGRILPQDKTRSALQALWRYNFTPDVGPYRKKFEGGRWYAMPGEAGLIMCTFPKGGEREARGGNPGHGFAGYLNECMNGFEYQAASHMIAEGLLKEGLAVTRAIHDRYHPSRRNPYNEIECGDHYARSMASHGVFVTLCGFECHGPKQHIGFAPRITPENFKSAFIAAEGWGSYSQRIENGRLDAEIEVHQGRLPLQSLALESERGNQVTASIGGKTLPAAISRAGKRIHIRFDSAVEIPTDASLRVSVSSSN